jgi:hypothetical protein
MDDRSLLWEMLGDATRCARRELSSRRRTRARAPARLFLVFQ